MASRKPISTLISSLTRPTTSTHYICRPCQHQIQLQLQQQHPSQIRSVHKRTRPVTVPKPTPFVPDVSTFLTLIGRKLNTHASKFETWDSLFTLTSPQLKELGVEPARSRRYLLRWREKFRNGDYGIGGDFKYVEDGVGELRVVEVPSLKPKGQDEATVSITQTPGMQRLIVNVPKGLGTYKLEEGQTTQDLKKPAFVTLREGHIISGTHCLPVKGSHGSAATLKIEEGLWEDKRGRKVFGGERRRAEVLHKMRVAERKKMER